MKLRSRALFLSERRSSRRAARMSAVRASTAACRSPWKASLSSRAAESAQSSRKSASFALSVASSMRISPTRRIASTSCAAFSRIAAILEDVSSTMRRVSPRSARAVPLKTLALCRSSRYSFVAARSLRSMAPLRFESASFSLPVASWILSCRAACSPRSRQRSATALRVTPS